MAYNNQFNPAHDARLDAQPATLVRHRIPERLHVKTKNPGAQSILFGNRLDLLEMQLFRHCH